MIINSKSCHKIFSYKKKAMGVHKQTGTPYTTWRNWEVK